jgi:hypothetical protein
MIALRVLAMAGISLTVARRNSIWLRVLGRERLGAEEVMAAGKMFRLPLLMLVPLLALQPLLLAL